MTDRQSVAGAYQKIEAHEDLCAERYQNINNTLGELKAGQQDHRRAAWGIVLALLGWMAVQLWNGHAPAAHTTPVVVASP